MRIKALGLFFFLCWIPQAAFAAWTGISAFAGQQKSDWLLSGQAQRADLFSYGLRIEEKTRPGLRIGIGAGRYDLRLLDETSTAPAVDYDGQFFLFYLRWPVPLISQVRLHTRFDYQYHVGESSLPDSDEEVEWTELSLRAGLGLRLDAITLQPFIQFRSIDGDVTSTTATRLFEHQAGRSQGLIIDMHVERTAYVRLQASFSAVDALYINFVREY